MVPKEPIEKTINRLIDEGFALMKLRKNDAAHGFFSRYFFVVVVGDPGFNHAGSTNR